MATRKSSKTTSQMTRKGQTRTAAAAAAAPAKKDATFVPAALPQPIRSNTDAPVTVRDEKGRTSPARHPAPMPESVRQKNTSAKKAAVKDKVKEDVKLVKAHKAANVKAAVLGGETVSKERLAECTASDLHDICRAYGKGKTARFAGHSTLRKDELVKYVATGVRPTVVKSDKAPNVGTMQYNLDVLRSRNGGKGYTSSDTAKCKAMFSCTISSLKAAQLTKLVAALGL